MTARVIGGVDTHFDVPCGRRLGPHRRIARGGTRSTPRPGATRRCSSGWAPSDCLQQVGVERHRRLSSGPRSVFARAGSRWWRSTVPDRQARRAKGKSDPADAVEAARAVLSGRATGTPKSRDGNVEAIRALLVAKRSARDARLRALHQMRQLSYTGPDQLRSG